MSAVNLARHRVLSAYRRLFRQQASTFSQDGFVQQRARAEIRAQFRAKAALTDARDVDEAVKAAEEAADYLRASVIQAKRVKGDHFGQPSSPLLAAALPCCAVAAHLPRLYSAPSALR